MLCGTSEALLSHLGDKKPGPGLSLSCTCRYPGKQAVGRGVCIHKCELKSPAGPVSFENEFLSLKYFS